MQELESWCRLFAAALVIAFAAQVLLGFSLHVHTLPDCESAAVMHSDYHAPVDIHLDQLDIPSDKQAQSVVEGAELLPVLLLIALLMLVWPRLHRPPKPLRGNAPPLTTHYALRPPSRAPPTT